MLENLYHGMPFEKDSKLNTFIPFKDVINKFFELNGNYDEDYQYNDKLDVPSVNKTVYIAEYLDKYKKEYLHYLINQLANEFKYYSFTVDRIIYTVRLTILGAELISKVPYTVYGFDTKEERDGFMLNLYNELENELDVDLSRERKRFGLDN